MALKNILFDLDGTLTDPKEGITKSITHALEKMGVAAPGLDNLTWCIGPPLRDSFSQLLNTKKHASIEQAISLYRERFSTTGIKENKPYEGIVECLKALKESGYRLFVATSKPAVYAREIVHHFSLSSYFEAIFGSELDGTRSDKAELIKYVLESRQLQSSHTAMVGDRKHDIIGAKLNGLIAVAITYGYGSKEELQQAGPHHLCESPLTLKDWLLTTQSR